MTVYQSVCAYFPFGYEDGTWDLSVLVPDHCLSFYFQRKESEVRFTEGLKLKIFISSIQTLRNLREFYA